MNQHDVDLTEYNGHGIIKMGITAINQVSLLCSRCVKITQQFSILPFSTRLRVIVYNFGAVKWLEIIINLIKIRNWLKNTASLSESSQKYLVKRIDDT